MGILVTSEYLLNYYPSNTSSSRYIEKNINVLESKFFGITGSLQYVSGSSNSAYFDKDITYTFTGSNNNEIEILHWAVDSIGYNEGIYLSMSIYSEITNRSKIYTCDTKWEQKEPWYSRLISASLYPPSSPITSKEKLLEYLSSSEYISSSMSSSNS